MFKKLFIALIIICNLTAVSFSADLESAVPLFFPKVKHLSGGIQNWLDTGIAKENGENYSAFHTSYSYMAEKGEILLKIKRKKMFSVNASVYVFKDFLSAYKFYEKEAEKAPKDRLRNVRFGDIGQFHFIPKSNYINDADFFLIFAARTYVVKINADDGFALMDVAHVMNSMIKRYLAVNYKTFLIKKVTLSVSAQGYQNITEEQSFAGDNPSELNLSGKVYDKDLNPLKGASVRLLETGDAAETNDNGEYQFHIALGGEKPLSLRQSFYPKAVPVKKKKTLESGFYAVSSVYDRTGRVQEHVWKLRVYDDRILGESLIDINGKEQKFSLYGTKKGNKINIVMDCSSATGRNCEQIFDGTYSNGTFKGAWSGTGGGGEFKELEGAFGIEEKKTFLNSENTDTVQFGLIGDQYKRANAGDSLVVGADDRGKFLFLIKPKEDVLLEDKDSIKYAKLRLTRLPGESENTFSIFTGDYKADENGMIKSLGGILYAAELKGSEEPYSVEFDITDYLKAEKYAGVLITPLTTTEDRGIHKFASNTSSFKDIRPQIIIGRYKRGAKTENIKKEPVVLKFSNEKADVVGRKNKIAPDGVDDISLKLVLNIDAKIESIEISESGGTNGSWNTMPLDIYPAVAVVKNGKTLNNEDSSVNFVPEGDKTYSLYIHKGDIDKSSLKLNYKIQADGRIYEGSVTK